MNANIQHPDITAAERTGYPCRAPIRMEVEIGEEAQRAYIEDHTKDFIDWCFADPDIIRRYLEEAGHLFRAWVQEALAG